MPDVATAPRSRKSTFTGSDPEAGDIIQDAQGRQWILLTVEKKRTLWWTTEGPVELADRVKVPDWIETTS